MSLIAKALSSRQIELKFKRDSNYKKLQTYSLYCDSVYVDELDVLSETIDKNDVVTISLFNKSTSYIPGHKYEIVNILNDYIPLDISYMAQEKSFEQKYRYEGKMGAVCNEEKTVFTVFSPFANSIILMLKKGDMEKSYDMKRDESGVFILSLDGDYDGFLYKYRVEMFSSIFDVTDPYALSITSNGKWGALINTNRLLQNMEKDDTSNLPIFDARSKAIIYECSIRDLTSLTQLNDKATFEALASCHDPNIGIDYITSLGISHVQLQPVLAFSTVNDDKRYETYNWGYDPNFYFALDGSLSSKPNDPYSRMYALKKIIRRFHSSGVRVTLDVVYNHLYSNCENSLVKLCPNYYLRLNKDKTLSNGSYCGCDLESRNYMCRKLILDSLSFLVDFYNVDGFRFDLMGIIDVTTLKEAYRILSEKKQDIFLYGEGWNMPTALDNKEKSMISNSASLPHISFFNDRFRDVVKGPSEDSKLTVKGYLTGDISYLDGFKHIMLGSVNSCYFSPMFASYCQSINYSECHDNGALIDKVKLCCLDDSEDEIISRIKMIEVATIFAFGVPFIHSGQEFLKSKNGCCNSYNAGDKINGIDYKLVSKNKNMITFLKQAIALKKKFINETKQDFNDLISHTTFEDLEGGICKINYKFKDFDFFIIFNPTKKDITYQFTDYVKLIFNNAGSLKVDNCYTQLAIIPRLSVNIFVLDRTKK